MGSPAETPRRRTAKVAWLAPGVASLWVRSGFVCRARPIVFNHIVASCLQIRRFSRFPRFFSPPCSRDGAMRKTSRARIGCANTCGLRQAGRAIRQQAACLERRSRRFTVPPGNPPRAYISSLAQDPGEVKGCLGRESRAAFGDAKATLDFQRVKAYKTSTS